ncbi:MAG TPA: SusD/RagB family nutrient-binding outer membrane lipoprotein [Chryseosolibacter sp.]
MKLIKPLKIWGLTALVFLASGCEKNFLDINVDPNNPAHVTPGQLLTSGEVNMVNSFGIGNPGLSTPASILVHQTVQRGSVDAYNVSGEDFQIQTAWQNLYSGALEDFKGIIDEATTKGDLPYAGVAKILTAYTYSIMVDLWGDIPFSEALQGAEIQFPHYDDDAAIYPQLLAMIDSGITDLASEGNAPAADDVIYGGDLDKWRKFAKTLKLKMYNQLRLVDDVSDEVNALLAEGDLMEDGGDFELQYGTSVSPDDRNPAFVVEYTAGNRLSYISPYFYEIMTNKSDLNNVLDGIADPRVPYYWFNQLTADDSPQNPTEYYIPAEGFLSIWFASQGVNQGFQQDRSQSVLGLYPMGGRYDDGQGGEVNTSGEISGPGDVAQRLLPYFSSLYIQAELALEEPGVTGDPRALFEDAMRASFDKVNSIADAAGAPLISNAKINTYVNAVLTKYDAAAQAGKLELIMTEKWIASFGFAIDSYTDYRRTGYPVMYDPNTDPLPYTVTSRGYPVSLAYNSLSLNLNQNAPSEQKTVTTDRIFWDPN